MEAPTYHTDRNGNPYQSTTHLLSAKLFKHQYRDVPRLEHLETSYHRAREIARHYKLTADDVISLTPKFWALHMDNIIIRDITAHILVTVQCNLVAGTIGPYALKRPDLVPLMDKILNFDVSTPFMLNEVGHGCDARNLETIATWQRDGTFLLHTPTSDAAKFMPPSMPIAGIPRTACVFARLIVEGEDRGIRPFIVPLGDGRQMCKGVKSWLFPSISCGRMLDHSLTTFDHVTLPAAAMLGDLDKPANMRDQFLSCIGRLKVGTLALTLWVIPFLKCAAFIVGKYSIGRTVQKGVEGERGAIISFRTQQLPILHALAQVAVMEPFADWSTSQHRDPSLSPHAKHGLSVILKVLFLHHGQASLSNLIERSGAQGVYIHNQMVEMESITRACGIAEGDVLVLSIRLATEILIGRQVIPLPTKPDCVLARHEAGIIAQLRSLIDNITEPAGHRGEEYNARILPHCRSMILAIGHRMAYEAALRAGIDPTLLALYEAGAIKADPSWYSENMGLDTSTQYEMERKACDRVLPQLESLLDGLGIEPYCTAPMLSPSRWTALIQEAPVYTGNVEVGIMGNDILSAKL